MNENLNLVEILKDCPKGTKLYSTVHGEVEYRGIYDKGVYRIKFKTEDGDIYSAAPDGRYLYCFNGECILFPSRKQRDWSKFKPKQSKFDPKTLQPFDKVLQFSTFDAIWTCDFYSHKINEDALYPYKCVGDISDRVIPYNDDTKHLVGTTEEAPEFYRYWED